ncbi:MAG: XdhC family protein [Candidatus Methanomethylicia archaeon]
MNSEELFRKITELLSERKTIALCTVIEKIGSGPRDIGAKMIVYDDGKTMGSIGGGHIERIIVKEALKAIKENKSREITLSLGSGEGIETGLICGGSIRIFIDIINPKPRLIIIGSGNIAKPLAEIANIVGFDVIIVDDNMETATKNRFPMVSKIIVNQLTKGIEELDIKSEDFIAIVHGDVEKEYEVLKKILKTKVRYLGLLGSKRKSSEIKRRLIEEGYNKEDVEKIHSPIGLDIGAETPEEIAVSITAELIAVLRGKI